MSTSRALSAALVIVGCFTACGGKYSGSSVQKPEMRKGGLDDAALPYQILERKGTQVDEAAFWDRISRARAVCVGEEHPNPHHHWVQLHVVRGLAKRVGPNKLALGLEMVQRPFQGPLDDYSAKRIDAETLKSRTGWAERWGYDWNFYAPTLDAAISAGGVLLALNAPKELVKKIVRQGLESLTADEKSQVPELKLDDEAHRAWFDNLMNSIGGAGAHSTKPADASADGSDKDGDTAKATDKEAEKAPPSPHGKGGEHAMPSAERIYTAQVLWDETMADGGAKWLKANPNGQLVILAGNGHCHDSAIVNRMKRRGVEDVVSIRAVIDDGEGGLAEVLAKPMNDFVVVLQLPKTTKTASK
jgi:uncharacterized iron-regulated protein